MLTLHQNWAVMGRFRLLGHRAGVREPEVLVDQSNMIMLPSAEVMAMALAGRSNVAVSHLYLGYATGTGVPYVPPALTPDAVVFPVTGSRGLARMPLTFPGMLSTVGNDRLTTFNFVVNSLSGFVVGGGPPPVAGGVWFDEAGLVVATDPASSTADRTGDRVFARVRFQDVQYDDTYNLSISWGIKLVAPTA